MNNLTLYSAAETVREMLEQLDPETGELPEGYDEARTTVAVKAQACAAFVLSNEAEADMVERHAKELLDRVKAARKRSAWVRQYIQTHMQASGITEIKALDGTFKASLAIGRDESVDVFDELQVPMDYMREKVTSAPDKALITKAIKDGFEVPGARLLKKDRLTIK